MPTTRDRSRIVGCSRVLVFALLSASAVLAAQDLDPDYAGTYSIIGLDPETGELGMAVQSKAFAVGNRTVTGKGGLVVLAHQASSNPLYGFLGVQLVQAGLSPADALNQIVRSDEMPDRRQVAILGIKGGRAQSVEQTPCCWKFELRKPHERSGLPAFGQCEVDEP